VTPRRHPDKEIRKALTLALQNDWSLQQSSGHRFGTLRCSEGCAVAIWSTQRNTSTHAKRIREAIERCPHHPHAT
jgi:hypothetical protein